MHRDNVPDEGARFLRRARQTGLFTPVVFHTSQYDPERGTPPFAVGITIVLTSCSTWYSIPLNGREVDCPLLSINFSTLRLTLRRRCAGLALRDAAAHSPEMLDRIVTVDTLVAATSSAAGCTQDRRDLAGNAQRGLSRWGATHSYLW